jgi:hypothetical protein
LILVVALKASLRKSEAAFAKKEDRQRDFADGL